MPRLEHPLWVPEQPRTLLVLQYRCSDTVKGSALSACLVCQESFLGFIWGGGQWNAFWNLPHVGAEGMLWSVHSSYLLETAIMHVLHHHTAHSGLPVIWGHRAGQQEHPHALAPTGTTDPAEPATLQALMEMLLMKHSIPNDPGSRLFHHLELLLAPGCTRTQKRKDSEACRSQAGGEPCRLSPGSSSPF